MFGNDGVESPLTRAALEQAAEQAVEQVLADGDSLVVHEGEGGLGEPYLVVVATGKEVAALRLLLGLAAAPGTGGGELIRLLGFDVVSAAEIEESETWEACLRRDIARALGMPLADAQTLAVFEPAVRGCGLGRRSLDDLLAEVVAWQRETFPRATPHSVAEHLRREVEELVASPTDAMEQADAMFLLAGLAATTGVDLYDAVQQKLEINRARLWGEPDSHGVVEHVREAEVVR